MKWTSCRRKSPRCWQADPGTTVIHPISVIPAILSGPPFSLIQGRNLKRGWRFHASVPTCVRVGRPILCDSSKGVASIVIAKHHAQQLEPCSLSLTSYSTALVATSSDIQLHTLFSRTRPVQNTKTKRRAQALKGNAFQPPSFGTLFRPLARTQFRH
jgi:hypothetical protein